jgi:hypothetical protein
MRRCIVVLALCALAGLPVAAASAAEPRLSLSRTAADPGQRVALSGHGFARSAALRVRLGGTLVRRARTGRRGGFRLRIRVPARRPGRYRLTARTGRRLAARFFRIRPPRTSAPEPAPPAPVLEIPAPVSEPQPAQPAQPPPPPPPPPPPTLVAAGDIACRPPPQPNSTETETACRHARTAALVATLGPDAVAVLGDNQYEHGELDNFLGSYDPTWGRFKAITHPAVGNHEYEGDPERDSAHGYYTYFGAAAGEPDEGYYRWSLGGWTVFALNSGAIDYTRVGGLNPDLDDDCWPVSCEMGSAQEQWLRTELDSLPDDACVLAYWHHPRFSSGYGGSWRDYPETAPLWDALHDHGAELVLVGHAHNYERFEPMDATGAADADNGITEFVVGTGGRSLFPNTGPERDDSEALFVDTFGVLELTLAPGVWSSRFVPETGPERDVTAGTCHGPPPAP